MCKLHHAMPKSLQDVRNAPDTLSATPRKKFCLGSNPRDDKLLAPTVLPCPSTAPQSPAPLRKKLWELNPYYHCSVIGTCLTLAELRQLQRRLGGAGQIPTSDYDLHRVFVVAARDATPASRLIHKHLDRKYKLAIQQIGKAQSAEAFATCWDVALNSGDIAGAYWALITQSTVPNSVLDRVYGEVHMLSHLSGASIRVDLQELNRLRRRCPELETQLADAKVTARRRLAEQEDAITALNKRLARALDAESRLQVAEARLAVLEGQPLAARLRAEVEELSKRIDAERECAERAEAAADHWKRQATRSIDQNQWLAQQLAESRQERDMLEITLERLLAPPPCADVVDADAAVDAACADLVGRCVLYVGGRQGLCAHFRELVERRNGRFIHHDGGREDARAQLWDVVRQADAVLCPLDCVSHDAVYRIKRFCERHTKPLVLLPRASLAAFNRGLNAVAS
ncbi:MAG: DUF2325 domain-containing protein [Candidatus Contendobacter sp.]|nr:DUF2325 domain-containing protein [Candidatus Contendobacter sp.]